MSQEERQNKKVQELQILEQQKQIFLMEKQSVQVELNEVNNASDELKKTDDEVYKILGGIMIRTNKNVLIQELNEKQRVLNIRISAFEKQEKLIEEKINKIRSEVVSLMKEEK
ncbi:MAG: prefoldin subunit [Nanoarchaeota archaeon]